MYMFEKRMEPLVRAAFLKRRVGYTRTVTRVLSSHYPTSLPPESPNKRIVSDDSLSRKKEECVKRKIENRKYRKYGRVEPPPC